MRRRTLLAALALSPFMAPRAHAAVHATTLRYDTQGRPLADVLINGAGPFSLVIDTAAGGTVLSAATIETLALTPSGRARMQGASGVTDTDLYSLASLEIAGLRREAQHAIEMPADSASSASHQGVLGAGMFSGARVEFDFAGNALRIDTNANRAPLANAIAVTFRQRLFAFAPVAIAGINATALIDTGARRSVGNAPLRAALGFSENDSRLRDVEAIGGATAHRTPTVAAQAPGLTFAGHDFPAFELAFANLPVFAPMQLANTPALILGVDLLRRARALTLDYSSAQAALRI